MAKIIIVEGPDCSGKSTLIERMSKDKLYRNSLVMKNNFRPTGDSIEDRKLLLEHYHEIKKIASKSKYEYVILDRFFISELAYSEKRGYEEIGGLTYDDFERVLNKLDVTFIYCNPGKKELLKRFKERTDEHILSKDELIRIYERYNKIYCFSKLKKIEYSGSDETYDQIYNKINYDIQIIIDDVPIDWPKK